MAHARIGRVRMKSSGAEIVPLRLVSVGEGFRFNPDTILSAAMGQGFSNLVVIGELPDGEMYVTGMANAGEALIMIECAKAKIISPAIGHFA